MSTPLDANEQFATRSPVGLILLAMLIAEREKKGPKRCKKKMLAIREALGEKMPDAIPVDPSMRDFWRAQRGAHELLEKHCEVCGRCSLGREAA